MQQLLNLYVDDTGSRFPDRAGKPRKDGMDCFGLGGILVRDEDLPDVISKYRAFRKAVNLEVPLHSSEIRGKRKGFAFLQEAERAKHFFEALDEMLLSIPVLGIAAVVDRPGYVARYDARYAGKPWLMCKTAFSIVVERAAKFAQRDQRKLKVFFEQAGEDADRSVLQYARALKSDGMPFDQGTSQKYEALSSKDFRQILAGEPIRQTKASMLLQIADLYLYPMAKAGYDPNYDPYKKLIDKKLVIDAVLEADELASCGVKYSCFTKSETENK